VTARSTGQSWFRGAYGAGPIHLLGTLAALVLTAYTVRVVGLSELWNPDVWWQSILVWFLGAIIAHDLILFPLYALADRLAQRGLGAGSRSGSRAGVSALNYVRIPIIAVALLFLLFFPGILQQGAATYTDATGQTQEPFLERWLLLSAGIFTFSAVAYTIRLISASRLNNSSRAAAEPDTQQAPR